MISAIAGILAVMVDILVQAGYTEWPLYLAPVFFAGFLRDNFWIVIAAVVASVLTFIGYFYPGSEDIDSAIVIFHRLFALFHIWFLTVILTAKNRAIGKLRESVDKQKGSQQRLKERESDLETFTSSLEDRVAKRTAQVHALSKALTVAEQRERLHFSQVLHDDLQQILFSAKMQLDVLGEATTGDNEERENDFAAVEKLIEKATATARSLALELNPPILKSEGLTAALRWLARHMEQRYGLTIDVHISPQVTGVGEVDRILIIQLVREILFNVVRHARTKNVSIGGELIGNSLHINVEDKGVGFDVEAVRTREADRSMGIFSMEERLKLFGGRLDIRSVKNEGTRVTIVLPINL